MNAYAQLDSSSNQLLAVDGRSWAARFAVACAGMVVLVGLADYFLYHLGWSPSRIVARSFNVGLEESFGTWVSTTLSLIAGVAALCIAYRAKVIDEGWLGWAVIGLFFIFISFDDAAKFHERLGTAVRVKVERATETELQSWFPSWGWQIYVAPFFAAMGAYLAWFLWRVLPLRLCLFSLLGLTCMGVAVGMDFLEGVFYRQADDVGHLSILTEEVLEMFGTVCFIYIFLTTLSRYVSVYLGPGVDQPAGEAPEPASTGQSAPLKLVSKAPA